MAFNPEEARTIENIDFERAFKKAEGILTRAEIKLGDFRNLYGEEVVEHDEGYVRERERQFGVQDDRFKKISVIFEAIFHEHAELSDWFGPNAFTIKSSRFDDLANGVDSILEFQEGETSASHLAMAVDVTFSADTSEKFNRLRREIEKGQMTQVKYFHSDHMNITGRLNRVPRVVIGADTKTIEVLTEAWLEHDTKVLANHPIQFQILEEILHELKAFGDYAVAVGKPEVAAIYERSYALVAKIYSERRKTVKDSGDRDSMFFAIKDKATAFSGFLKKEK